MPSPALTKLEQLPLTPLSSAPGSPTSNRSQPSSRRGSSSASSFPGRRPSIPASLAANASSSYFTAPNTGASLSALTSIKNLNRSNSTSKSGAGATNGNPSGQEEIHQAVDEEHSGLPMAGTSLPTGDSAIDDSSSSSEDEEEEMTRKEDKVLRTGNERLKSGSRRLSRMSSTLGEGVTAHWRRSDTTSNTQDATSSTTKSPLSASTAAANEPFPSSKGGSSIVPTPLKSVIPSHLTTSPKPTKPKPTLSPIEHTKRLAAYRAVDVHVKPHHKVIGIGSGSTVPYVVERILEMGMEANRRRWFVPTGFQSKELIVNAGLKLGDVDQFPKIDVTIDGADDVDIALNAIKGGGACHLREKVLAEAADEFVIVADYRKNNLLLGDSWTQGVPIECPPFAYSKVLENLRRIPGCINPTLRMGKAKAGPLVTDNGNFVIDAPFDEAHMREPEALLGKIKMLTGVVECGLFCRMARAAYFGNQNGTVTVRWSDGQSETLAEGEEAKIRREDVDENVHLRDELLVVDLEKKEGDMLEIQTVDDHGGQEELRRKLEQLNTTKT